MSDSTPTNRTWLVAGLALIAAMVPHFFFTTPLDLHMYGDMDAWIAIAVWAPSMLAGAGFFDAGEFGDAFERRSLERLRVAALAATPFLYLLIVAILFKPYWTGMPRVPWDELMLAVPLFAGTWALMAVYWQGLVQHRLLADKSPALRVSLIAVGHLVVFGPWVMHTGLEAAVTGYLSAITLAGLIGAVIFELGSSVRAVMLVNALMGAAFIWVQQAKLL